MSQGRDRDEARRNLLEAVQIQLEEMAQLGTLDEYLSECGYVHETDVITSHIELQDDGKTVAGRVQSPGSGPGVLRGVDWRQRREASSRTRSRWLHTVRGVKA